MEKNLKESMEGKLKMKNENIMTTFPKFKNLKEEIKKRSNNINEETINDKKLKEEAIKVKEKISKKLEDINLINMIEYYEEKINEIYNKEDLDESSNTLDKETNQYLTQIKIQKIQKNSEYLKDRRKNLEEIQIITAQIKDMTNTMKDKVQKDEEALKEIEDNVQNVHDNVESGLKDIKEINKNFKENKKKICCIIFMIIFVLAAVGGVLFALIHG